MAMLRNRGVGDNLVYDNVLEKDLMTIWIHHGGALLRSPHRRYVGGAVDCYDYVDGSSLSLEKIKDFVSRSRPLCDKNKTRFYFKYKDDFDKGCMFLKKDSDSLGLLQFFKKGNQVDIYVEHNDLDAMLRAEAAGGKIRQDFIEDVEDDVDDNMNSCGSVFVRADRGDKFDINSGSDDSEFRSSDESEGLLDEEWQAFRAKEAALKAIYGDECK
ncbi:hypothetical protein LIER_07920 [Lithospermum erythrorhizon]|uniref:PB1-like domain-containing protein n=1 Tax=Lithospermum erythrorhizon TaxID=34254 RepID=A0AAV3PC10_LITER